MSDTRKTENVNPESNDERCHGRCRPGRRAPRGRALLFALVGLLAAGGLARYAFAGDGFGWGGHCKMGERDPEAVKAHAAKVAGRALDRVDATDPQRDRVLGDIDTLVDELLARKEEHDALRSAFHEALAADTVDPAEIERLRAEAVDQFDRASRLVAQHAAGIAGALTAEQRRELIETLERFHR